MWYPAGTKIRRLGTNWRDVKIGHVYTATESPGMIEESFKVYSIEEGIWEEFKWKVGDRCKVVFPGMGIHQEFINTLPIGKLYEFQTNCWRVNFPNGLYLAITEDMLEYVPPDSDESIFVNPPVKKAIRFLNRENV